mmetsp:Transcript_14190/g.56564  ORF Transcript_14190/g.56564 Transcript_14190/m.56564 type:complete len:235 (-) Transcript_14190:210-914(-)
MPVMTRILTVVVSRRPARERPASPHEAGAIDRRRGRDGAASPGGLQHGRVAARLLGRGLDAAVGVSHGARRRRHATAVANHRRRRHGRRREGRGSTKVVGGEAAVGRESPGTAAAERGSSGVCECGERASEAAAKRIVVVVVEERMPETRAEERVAARATRERRPRRRYASSARWSPRGSLVEEDRARAAKDTREEIERIEAHVGVHVRRRGIVRAPLLGVRPEGYGLNLRYAP